MKRLLVTLAALMAFAAPAHAASTPDVVTKHEFSHVYLGDTRGHVTNVFDTRGHMVKYWYPEHCCDAFQHIIYGHFHVQFSYPGWAGGTVYVNFKDPDDSGHTLVLTNRFYIAPDGTKFPVT